MAGDVWNDSGSVDANEQDKAKERGEEEVAVSGLTSPFHVMYAKRTL